MHTGRRILAISLLLTLPLAFLFGLRKEFDFYGLKLGMTEEQVKTVINSNPDLKADTSRYLGKINEEIPFTLKAKYHPFIPNLYINFYKGKSYQMIIVLNPHYFDFFTLTETMEDKYGVAQQKTSREAKWYDKTNTVRLSVEYPCTVKIYDDAIMRQVHTEVSQTVRLIESSNIIQRQTQAILDEF